MNGDCNNDIPPHYNHRLYCGTKVFTLGTAKQDLQLLSRDEIITIANSMGNIDHADAPCVAVMNGDWDAIHAKVIGCSYQNGVIVVHLDKAYTGKLRVNYIIGFA